MSPDQVHQDSEGKRPAEFVTTHWSLVLAAGQRDDSGSECALAELCQCYWLPIYAYVRRRTPDVQEAQDMTQAFFARMLEKEWIANADPDRGRFRAFLLTACKRFLVDDWHKQRAKKRGGDIKRLSLDFDSGESKLSVEVVDSLTPERLFEQKWAITLLARVLDRLEGEFETKGKLLHFDQLKKFLSGAHNAEDIAAAGKALGMSDKSVIVAAHRFRKKYRKLLRAEISQTVDGAEEVEDEIRWLFGALGS